MFSEHSTGLGSQWLGVAGCSYISVVLMHCQGGSTACVMEIPIQISKLFTHLHLFLICHIILSWGYEKEMFRYQSLHVCNSG